ncbi:MAG: sigma-70 family RNA polymerase sigma factor [Zhongshania sp.]|uniref:Sigma-70 family RNA polymerase sigma factor n=1 Tax=Zhongshania guokunii TaxID=641783 RepID=A0ABV3U5Q5_9GAMM|nr:sigma-70 family RNA polymerase sigma factor [Zhongshania sp.]MDF1692400.1 sigma-70 family RNA polymerase sigma factor [Zhongshania sp.]
MTNCEDDLLVSRAGKGEHAAFEVLVNRHLDAVLGFAERMIGTRADAEDIAQDTFAKAWQQARRWKPGQAQYRTWLFQLAMNLIRDRWRKQRPSEPLDDTIADTQATPDSQLQSAAQAARVNAALQQLPERQRAAIILNHYHGLGNIETALAMDASVESVESLLGRARRSLRQSLNSERV